jgi:hypothetical protein
MVTVVISSLAVGGVSYHFCQKGLGNPRFLCAQFNQESMVQPLSDAVDTLFQLCHFFLLCFIMSKEKEGFKQKKLIALIKSTDLFHSNPKTLSCQTSLVHLNFEMIFFSFPFR